MARRQAITEALAEARMRVFGGGFDASFKIVLVAAYLAGAFFLAHRGGGIDPVSTLAGLVSMALYLGTPIFLIFVFVAVISWLARISGTGHDADPSMRAVALALALTLAIGVALVMGIARIPVVGAQLRAIFA